jgi:uncharacterized protein GlcG (DUF336 family)
MMMEAMIQACHEKGYKMCIAIVDESGFLQAFIRMEGAWLGSIDIAIKKARAAALFDMDCHALADASLPHIEQTNGGLVTFPGGVCVEGGAIGVSGGSVSQDLDIARIGAEACATE